MAIKKPLTKRPAAREPEEEDEVPVKKSLKKRAPEPAEDEDEDAAEDAEPEPPKKKSKLAKNREPEPDDDDDDAESEPAPRKGSGLKKKSKAKRSLADIFDKTKPGRASFPVGTFKAYVVGLELDGEVEEDIEDQGPLVVKITFEGHEDEEEGVAGKSLPQRYTIVGKDGEINEVGIGILKGDLDVLGYEDVLLEDLEDICVDVEAERPVVVIKTKQNNGYTNAYIQGLPED